MSQATDARNWTGLYPDGLSQDVRLAQNPRDGGSIPLDPQTYRSRLFNIADLFTIFPLALVVLFILEPSWSSAATLLAILSAVFIAMAALKLIWIKIRGDRPAIVLNADGLHLTYQTRAPIPWSKIGDVRFTYGEKFRWVSVLIDKDCEVVQDLPWPLSKLDERHIKSTSPLRIISCWHIKANPAELRKEIARFRDNYCAD